MNPYECCNIHNVNDTALMLSTWQKHCSTKLSFQTSTALTLVVWQGNSTMVCHNNCMTICTGSAFLSIPVHCRLWSKAPSTGSTTALQSRTLPADATYIQPASCHHLTVPHYGFSTFGHRAFSVTGQTVWNSLRHCGAAASANHWRQTSLTTVLLSKLSTVAMLWLCTRYVHNWCI